MQSSTNQAYAFRSLSIANSALKVGFRDRTVIWLAILFLFMVSISAYLGWAASQSLDAIYQKAVPVLTGLGKPVPLNPALDISPLSALRNMTTYVSLLGALAALVFGNQLIGTDRKSGVMALIMSRPFGRNQYIIGKIVALLGAIGGILLLAAAVNATTMLILPGQSLSLSIFKDLAGFYAISALYLMFFGLIGAYFALACKSEALAILIPMTIWLVLTFVLPQVTGNINPMAALNPVKATIVPPTAHFFAVMNSILGPVSLAEIYRSLASTILGFASADNAARLFRTNVELLLAANVITALSLLRLIHFFDASRSDYND